eukprot:14572283-Ditylum_brightwellii.AAC.1
MGLIEMFVATKYGNGGLSSHTRRDMIMCRVARDVYDRYGEYIARSQCQLPIVGENEKKRDKKGISALEMKLTPAGQTNESFLLGDDNSPNIFFIKWNGLLTSSLIKYILVSMAT